MERDGDLAVLASLGDFDAGAGRCDVLLEENLEGLAVREDIYGRRALGTTGTTIADRLDPNFVLIGSFGSGSAGNDEGSSGSGCDERGEGSDGELHIK